VGGAQAAPNPETIDAALAVLKSLTGHSVGYVVRSAHTVAAHIEARDWDEVVYHLKGRPWLKRRLAQLFAQCSPELRGG